MCYKKNLVCTLFFLLLFLYKGAGQTNQLVVLIINTTGTTCNQPNGSIIATATGGTPPYTYDINHIEFHPTGYFISLYAGTYTITVTDATGATATAQATLSNAFTPPNFSRWDNAVSPTGCDSADGSVTLWASGGTPPYTYSADNVTYQSSNVFNNLAQGPYYFLVKDANGCVIEDFGRLYAPSCGLSVDNSWLPYYCPPKIIYFTPTQGTAPFTYSIDGINYVNSGTSLANLPPALYHLRVKDATGKEAIWGLQVWATYCPPVITTTAAACQYSNGTITATPQSGTPPFTYTIDGIHFQTSNVFTNLRSGYYYVTVTDADGKTISVNAFVDNNCPTVSAIGINETCGLANGKITATGSKGILPYTYSIDGLTFQTSRIFTGLAAGTYTITIKDADGYTNTTTITITNSCLTVTATPANGICGNPNGKITATGSYGTTPYQYSIDGINFQTDSIFSGLASGAYTITIKDAIGTTKTTTVTVGNAAPQIAVNSTPASCSNQDGTVTITGTGGTSPLQYSLDDITFQSNYTFNNLATGTYTASIKDANGCMATVGILVSLVNDLTVDAGADATICEGAGASLSATSNGNSFAWTPTTGLNNASQLTPVASPTSTTKYFITATSGPCTQEDSVMVFVNPAPVATTGTDTIICYGQNATLTGSGGISCSWTPATYLDNALDCNPAVINPTQTITYHLTVTDAKGCPSIQPATFTVNVTPPAKIFAGNDTTIVANQPFQLYAQDINNSGFTQYSWSPALGLNNPFINNPIASISQPVTYTVTAATPAGCTASDDINIKIYPAPEIYVPNAFTPNGDGRNDVLKAIPVGIKEFRYFSVYNRWGQMVFFSNRPDTGWDGRLNTVSQNTNTFVWKAAGIDYKGNLIERKGVVVLIR